MTGDVAADRERDAGAPRTEASAVRPRRSRRAVRPGAGDLDPSVDLRSADDSDLGWQPPAEDSNDERLRRDVPPHW